MKGSGTTGSGGRIVSVTVNPSRGVVMGWSLITGHTLTRARWRRLGATLADARLRDVCSRSGRRGPRREAEMRRLLTLLGLAAAAAAVAIPAAAEDGDDGRPDCGETRGGYVTIFDGSRRCFERWRYAGGASMTLQRDGTSVRTGPARPRRAVVRRAAVRRLLAQAAGPRRRTGRRRARQQRHPGPLPGAAPAGARLPDDVQRRPDRRRRRTRVDRGQLRPRGPDQRQRRRATRERRAPSTGSRTSTSPPRGRCRRARGATSRSSS